MKEINMQYNINGKDYGFSTNVRDNNIIRNSFNELAKKTFKISFEQWYKNGYWSEKYTPHVLIDDNRVVANVSVNSINTVWNNQKRLYIQLGTVMTDAEYRGKGLSRFLIEKIIKEQKNNCDAIYLFANDSVVDFYPKFGFVKAEQYQYSTEILSSSETAQKLDMTNEADKEFLIKKYNKGNPFSVLPMLDNVGLLMFYCSQFMQDNVYYVKEYDAVVIADQNNNNTICYDIFCDEDNSIEKILPYIVKQDCPKVLFGFTPKENINYKASLLKEKNTTLFVLSSKENIFTDNKVMFPLLSHA